MTRLLILLLAATSVPALAQHGGHHMPAPPKARPAPQPARPAAQSRPAQSRQARPRAATPRRTQVARPVTRRPAAPAAQPDPHAGHGAGAHPQAPAQSAAPPASHGDHQEQIAEPTDPHAGHDMAAPAAADPHAGHGGVTPQPADAHAGHDQEAPAPPVGPPPPAALAGPEHAADSVFGSSTMAAARNELHRTHGDMRISRFTIDQLEFGVGDGRDSYAWEDLQLWYGGDLDKLWLKSEGEGRFGEGFERGDVQALWSHAIDPWFDLQAGVRMNFGPGPERPHLVLGILGLAPYWFEIDAAVFLSSAGDLTARAEVEYDLRITQRLILQPRVEAELALQDIPELGIGAGLSSAEAGLRLRYELAREFAPYVGVEYERSFGDTARFARAAGDDAGGWRLVVGTRLWF